MKHCLFSSLLLAFAVSSCTASKSATPPALTPVIKSSAAMAPAKVPAVPVKLSANGQALLPVVIGSQASEKTREMAHTLAEYLHQISGGTFAVETSAKVLSLQTPGIVIGTSAEFSDASNQFDVNDPTRTEDYLLRSHAGGVLLVGASDKGVRHAVWDLLYRLGYRQFFPGKNWEVIPNEKNINVSVSTFEHPDYYARRIWPNYGTLKVNGPKWALWNARNRMGSGISLNTGHAYDTIIRRNKKQFEEHPEYLTKPRGNKFCASNPGLQQLVIDFALKQFDKNPNRQSISMDPSDGGNWESDSCPDSTVYNSVTDRVVTLANLVAEAVNKKYPGKFVGMYAYNDHSPPPTIEVDEHVIPSIATGFIRGGFTMDQLLDGWSEKADRIGIREYYSVYQWHKDLPGHARGSNINYLTRTIAHFHAKKARFMTAESADNWGPNGLGYYIASRLLWDTANADNVDSLINDFLDKSFGSAKVPMRHFYQLINGIDDKPVPPFSKDYIGRLYRTLEEAREATDDDNALARINDLVLYVRYLELYWKMNHTPKADRQAAFNDVLRYSWRIRDTEMVHTIAVWRALARYVNGAKVPPGSGHRVPEAKDPLKGSEPFTDQDIQKIITDGIANNELLDFTPVSYSEELVPATPLQLKSGKAGSFKMLRGTSNLYTWINEPPATIDLRIQAGLIYSNRGAAQLELYPITETSGNSGAHGEALPDKQPHSVQLKSTFVGLQRIQISDGTAGTAVTWAPGTPMTIESSLNQTPHFAGGRWTMYFYVPKGTTVLGGYGGRGTILDSEGKKVWDFSKGGYWSVLVPPGQDGKLWKLNSMSGAVRLMTVPPYLARSADELLLPKEVVEADAVKN